jgi:biopolymer transport protein ExbD
MRIPTLTRSSRFQVNMTPMIDVTFLLIIFFLVSSHLGKQEHHVKLELPQGRTGLDAGLSQKTTTTVQVLPDGSLMLGGQAIALQRFTRAIAAQHAETPGGLRIRIRTDRQVPYSEVSKILKACTQSGISDVAFAVTSPDG